MIYFPMRITQGVPTRVGRSSTKLSTAIRQARLAQLREACPVVVVDPTMKPVWASAPARA